VRYAILFLAPTGIESGATWSPLGLRMAEKPFMKEMFSPLGQWIKALLNQVFLPRL